MQLSILELWGNWVHPNRIAPGFLNRFVQKLFPFFHVPCQRAFALKWGKFVVQRLRTSYFMVFFAMKAQDLLDDGKGSDALCYLNICAPTIVAKLLRAPRGIERRALFNSFCGIQTNIFYAAFQVITEEASPFSGSELGQLFKLFQSSDQFTDLIRLKGLVDGTGTFSLEELAKVPFSSNDLKYLCVGLMLTKKRDWRGAINVFREVRDERLRRYAKFLAALIMRKGDGRPTFTKEIGLKILEQLRGLGYKPAIEDHLKCLAAKATTPQDILNVFEYADSANYDIPPKFEVKLFDSIRSQIRKMRKVEEDCERSCATYSSRLNLEAEKSTLSHIHLCLRYANSAFDKASADLDEAKVVYRKICTKRGRYDLGEETSDD
jgi:hypothetical protein